MENAKGGDSRSNGAKQACLCLFILNGDLYVLSFFTTSFARSRFKQMLDIADLRCVIWPVGMVG